MAHSVSTLKNGLRVASERLPGVESVAVAVSVAVGARHEAECENGISHLLEHMAFKGTKTRSARDIAESFDAIGGQFNAYTSNEYTVYYAKVLAQHLPVAVEILSDILLNSVFDANELKREQGVVLQEIAMQRDTPDDLIFDLFDTQAYPDQPLGRSILGTPERVSSYSREEVMGYMQRHYTPMRMTVSAAGKVDHEALVALAEKFTLSVTHEKFLPIPATYVGGDYRREDDLEQVHMLLGFPAVSVHDDDYYAMQLYSAILGGGMSSRLFQEIREKRGMAYSVHSHISALSDAGTLVLYSATSDTQAAELPLLLADELKRMAEGVQAKELDRVKNQHKAELLMAREQPGTVAGALGKHLLMFGHYREIADIIKRIDAVSEADIRRLAETVLTTQKPTLAAIGPVTKMPSYEAIKARLVA